MGVPLLPSTFAFPGMKGTELLSLDTFTGRLQSAITYLMSAIFLKSKFCSNTTLLQQYAPEISDWSDLVRRSELFLLDYDYFLGEPYPAPPNVILVAGTTLRPPKKLPADIEKIYAKSENGVVVVSFGSTAYYLPREIIVKLLESFGRLPHTVIARLPLPEGVERPKNVHLLSWMPQNDMLADNRTRLFITHCGSNGLHETIYNAVPILGFPLFAEQEHNCFQARRKGFGRCMDIHDFSVDDIEVNVREIVQDMSYKMAISKLSAVFRDQPMTSSAKAAFWIEHVIKHGGQHLRSIGMQLSAYQIYMFDLLAFFVAAFVALLVSIFCLLKLLLKCCSKSKSFIHGDKKQQ